MQEIDEFKKNNGNVTYSVKELLGGIHIKLDRITERLENGDNRFTTIETNIRWHKRLILGLYSIVGALVICIISTFKRIFGG
jgi:hypothetical protein